MIIRVVQSRVEFILVLLRKVENIQVFLLTRPSRGLGVSFSVFIIRENFLELTLVART